MRRFTLNILPRDAAPLVEEEPIPVVEEKPEPVPVIEEKPKSSRLNAQTVFLADTLGFLPTNFIDDVINAMNSLIYEALGEVEKFLQDKFAETPEVAEKVRSRSVLSIASFALDYIRNSNFIRKCSRQAL